MMDVGLATYDLEEFIIIGGLKLLILLIVRREIKIKIFMVPVSPSTYDLI